MELQNRDSRRRWSLYCFQGGPSKTVPVHVRFLFRSARGNLSRFVQAQKQFNTAELRAMMTHTERTDFPKIRSQTGRSTCARGKPAAMSVRRLGAATHFWL